MACRFPILAALMISSLGLARADPPAQPPQENKPFDDAAFVQMVANDNMFEIAVGKIAETNARSEPVKQFAQRMMADHTKAEKSLQKAATAAGLTTPTTMDEKHEKMVEKFKGLEGEGFDTDYIRHMIPDHEKAIALFTQASKEARNQAIRDYAGKTLPVIEEHLMLAKKLKSSP